MATLKEIAEKAGVSYTAASFVVNGKWPGLVNKEAVAKVKKVLKDVNYISNSHARRLVTRKTETIGIITSGDSSHPVPTDPFFSRIFTGIVIELQKRGYDFALAPVDSRNHPLNLAFPELKNKQVDGIILMGGVIAKDDEKCISDISLPVVIIGDYFARERLTSISIDETAGSYQAVKHLVNLGHRHIGFLAYKLPISSFNNRHSGYLKALRDSDIEPDGNLTIIKPHQNNYKAGYYFAETLLSQTPRPTAIFCANDIIAMSAMQKIREMGLNIPKDISIIGFDDIAWASAEIPPLTTVHIDIEKMGRTAVSRLVDYIEGRTGTMEKRVVLPTKLIIRESCGKPRR